MRVPASLVPLLLSLVACGDGDGDPNQPPVVDDEGTPCTDDDGCALHEICGADEVCVTGDRTDAADEALPLLFDTPVTGVIQAEGDVDYFTFETLSDGQWITLRTVHESDPLDTHLTLRRANGQIYATANDYGRYSTVSNDSVLTAYLPQAGTWIVEVADVREALSLDADPVGDEDQIYELYLETFSSVTDETDNPLEITVEGDRISRRGVVFETDDDVDTLLVDVRTDGTVFELTSRPEDVPGSPARLAVEMERGGEVLVDQPTVDAEHHAMILRSEPGEYTVRLSEASGTGSADHWAVFYLTSYDNPDISRTFWGTLSFDLEVEPNDAVADATSVSVLDYTTDGGTAYTGAPLEGVLDAPGDVDLYAMDASAGDRVTVWCYADLFGSLADLTVAVLDDTGTELGRADDDEGDGAPDPRLYNVPVDTDTVLIEVSGEDDVSGPGASYRCLAYATTFDVEP